MALRHLGRMRTTPSSTSTALENLETRRLYSGLGINANQVNATNYGPMVEMLRASGTTDVRLWYGFTTYQERSLSNIAKYADKFHHDGFNVTLVVSPRNGRHGTYDETQGLITYLVGTELKDSVDQWEIGNEPGSQNYWRGNVANYTTDFLIPAAKVLQAAGETVISGAPAWNPEEVQTMVDNGMLKYVDYVGFHPYSHNIGQLKSKIARLREIVGDKPLAGTEWNMRGHENDSSKDDWASDVEAMAPVIRQNFAISHYFAATVQDSMAGPAGVITLSGKPNRPFYNSWFAIANSAQVVSPPDPGGGDDNGGDNGGGDDSGGDDNGGKNPDTGGGTDDGGTDTSKDGDTDNSGTNGGTKDGGGKTTNTTKPTKPAKDGDVDTSDGTGNNGDTGTGDSGTADPVTGTSPDPVTPPVVVIPPAISSLSLLNTSRDRVIAPYAVLSGVVTVDLASTGTANLSVLASANNKTASVKFTLNGSRYIDNDGTFTLFGESGSDLKGVDFTAGKVYAMTAQAFTGANATGDAGALQTVLINVIDTGSADAAIRTPANQAALAAARRRAMRDVRDTGPSVLPGL